eukprot:CAMPEP_0114235352 /NCGR_PEP_ID=MMETSP0058-20121206/6204_1 /TAXON_ID=36894 /ORGANISM="Pyramimonas parkeae, CCMP726" /LENGTH=132 /DNA_ID=CAMNT_0001347107 /DNA_START=204 /DNA_END=599 /DNA_ORIENTATION=+
MRVRRSLLRGKYTGESDGAARFFAGNKPVLRSVTTGVLSFGEGTSSSLPTSSGLGDSFPLKRSCSDRTSVRIAEDPVILKRRSLSDSSFSTTISARYSAAVKFVVELGEGLFEWECAKYNAARSYARAASSS